MSSTQSFIGKLIADRNKILAWAGLFGLYYLVGTLIPEGFDWVHYFSIGRLHPVWTPWTALVLPLLTFPLLVAITLMALTVRTFRYSRSPYPLALAILSLPTFWVLLLGNLDGLVLVGLLLLPWGAPLVLMKPQIAAFALLAKPKYLLAGAIWFGISLLVWGWWPLRFLAVLTPEWAELWNQDITLFPWGLLLALPLLWLSRGDQDLLMAAGSFATPHLFPYHFILLMPALARMNWKWMTLAWAVSWLPLSAQWLGDIGWRFGNVLGLVIWLGIYLSARSAQPSKSPPEIQAAEPA